MRETALHYIGGAWTGSEQISESINPGTGAPLGSFAAGGAEEALTAAAAARQAFNSSGWAHRPRLRAAVLLTFADLMAQHKIELAQLLAAENGKPISGAMHEVNAGISEFRYYAGLARTIFGRVMEVDTGLYATLAREPTGVAGIIVPWNAPVTLLVRSLAPALAAGCTAVVKAAPQTALINEAVFRLLASVEDLPSGVLNMFTELESDGARALVTSPEIDIISYTGSTHTGKLIMEAAAGTLKRLSLELGGSAPVLVFPDANLDQMAPAIAKAGTIHAGQMCTAASRIIVHASKLDEVQARLCAELPKIIVGRAENPQTQMGPLIDIPNRERVRSLVAEAAATDELLLHGDIPDGDLAKGAFIRPSLLAVKSPASPMLKDEVFGPALSLDSFLDEEEGVAKANNTRYGLAASVWTEDLRRGQRVAGRNQAGTVWINAHNRLMAETETGGYKESGIGRLHGVEGLESFLQTKHISWELKD